MTSEEFLDDKYGASVEWFSHDDMVDNLKEYALQIAQEAVRLEWEHDDTSESMVTADNVLTRIKKLTEES